MDKAKTAQATIYGIWVCVAVHPNWSIKAADLTPQAYKTPNMRFTPKPAKVTIHPVDNFIRDMYNLLSSVVDCFHAMEFFKKAPDIGNVSDALKKSRKLPSIQYLITFFT
jgi:hypothetical protein